MFRSSSLSHVARATLLVALLLGAACQPAANEPPSAPESESPGPGAKAAKPLAGADTSSWPCWRGPTHHAVGAATDAPSADWLAEAPRPWWQTPLGSGWSSPVVARGVVVVTDRQADAERVLAFEAATGEPRWKSSHPIDFDPHPVGRRHGNGPKSTPVIADETLFAVGIAGLVKALDLATGQVRWQLNLPAEFGKHEALRDGRAYVNGTENVIVPIGKGQGAPVPLFGYTGSPLVADGKLILSVGGELGGTIMALDVATGQTRWKALDEHVSYSSPVVARLGGIEQVVAMTGPRVVGLRLSDGALLWSHPFQIQYDESIGTPLVAGDLVMFTGDGKPLVALRITGDGTRNTKQVAWENWDLSSYLSSMVSDGEQVYGMSDDGRYACVRLADGKTLWQGGDLGYYASPILLGDRLLSLNDRGEIALLAAQPSAYRLLGTAAITDRQSWTMPAVAAGQIFVRSGDALACYDLTGAAR